MSKFHAPSRPVVRPVVRTVAASVALTGLLASGCSDSGQRSDTAGLPSDHHLTRIEFPLFEDFAAERNRLLAEREAAGKPETRLTDEVLFAETFDEAFERATREDKPVLLATFVRENGDPHCDV